MRISDWSSDVCSSDLFFEYCLVIPANRIGYGVYSAAELKTLQEVVTLIIFAGFAVFWLGEKLTVNHLVGFGLIAAGAFLIFKGPIEVCQDFTATLKQMGRASCRERVDQYGLKSVA